MKRFWAILGVFLLFAGTGPSAIAQGPAPGQGALQQALSTGIAPAGLAVSIPQAVWPGPDGFGYVGQTAPFSYVDIHTTGTLIPGLTDDSYAGPFPIGFTFNFYGVGKTQFYVSSNGHIEFDTGSSSLYAYCPYPNASNPANHVALMFDDLYPNYSTGGVYRQTFASCPYPGYAAQQCLVVQYYNWYHFGGGVAGDFEVILTSGGDMIFQYNDGGAENCSNSVEGIQGANVPGDYGLQYACRQANSCPDGTAFKIGLPTGVIVTPDTHSAAACPGDAVPHPFTVLNFTGSDETFSVTYSGNVWPVVGPSMVGPIPQGGSAPLVLTVTIPLGYSPGDCDTVDILVEGATTGYTDTASAETCVRVGGLWEPRAPAPFVSMDDVVVHWQGKTYLVGGYGANGMVGIYDPETDSWTTGASEPSPVIQYPVDGCLGLNASGEPVVVLFPDTASGVTTLHRYNIATNSWDTPPVPSGFPVNGLWAHDVLSMLEVDGTTNVCYISGGATTPGGGNVSTLYRYDPATNTVQNLGNFTHHPAGFDFHASWYVPWIGTQGAVCVGSGVDASSVVFPDTQCYDIGAGVFNPPNADLGPMLEGVWGTADSFVVDAGDYQLWVANGANAAFQLWQHSMYFSQSDMSWHYGADPLYAVYRVEGDSQLGMFHVVGGSSGGFTPTVFHERLTGSCPVGPTFGASKTAPVEAINGERISYTIVITAADLNPELLMTDPVPAGAEFAGNLQATQGVAWYDPAENTVYWAPGDRSVHLVGIGQPTTITVTFDVTVTASCPETILNEGTLCLGATCVPFSAETAVTGPLPQAAFYYSAERCTVSFFNDSLYATEYLWAFGDGEMSTEENPVHVYAASGVYTVTLTATNSCGSSVAQRAIELNCGYFIYLPIVFKGYQP